MAFAQSFYKQSSVFRINVMVVDDDPVFLQIIARKLEKLKVRDPSTMEITVVAVKDSSEAMSTLQIQRNNIDLIITDYYMPGMNGLQLKKQINREYGNLPVIVMSSDTNKAHESLTCGAIDFIPKPIKATEITRIYQLAFTCKRNGKSTLWTDENNHNAIDVSIPQQIQLVPDQDSLKVTKKNKFSSRPDSRSVNSSNGSCASADASRKKKTRKPNRGAGDGVESLSQASKKSKITWTHDLHYLFLQAMEHLGLDKAVPKKILEFMNVPYLTRENIASHLQKYRQFLKNVAVRGSSCSSRLPSSGIDSIYPYSHNREPYYNNYTPSPLNGTSLNNRSLIYSKPGHGLGQSRLLSNISDPVRFNQMPHNYMNRSSTYEPHRVGSNLNLPIEKNLNYSSQNEGRKSFGEPTANKTSQTSQVLGFEQHGLSAINGSSFNNNTLISYASIAPNQPGVNTYKGSTSTQPGMSSYGSVTATQPIMSSHETLPPNQLGMSSYENLTSNLPGMNSYGSLSHDQPCLSSFGNLNSNQLGSSNHGILSPNQPGLKSYGSATHDAQLNNFRSLISHQPGSSNFFNNENTAYKTQPQTHANATAQPNAEVTQQENLSLFDELGNINELSCDISNFQFDHNTQQEAVLTTQFEFPANFSTEMNQLFSLEEDEDWSFLNVNQGHSNGETSNNVVAPEKNSQIFDMSTNHDQEQDAPIVDWSFLNPEDLANEFGFMDSLFNGMNRKGFDDPRC